MITKRLTKAKAIRRYCVDVCMNGQQSEVKICTIKDCPLYPYRMGHEDIEAYSQEIALALSEKAEKRAERLLSAVKIESCE